MIMNIKNEKHDGFLKIDMSLKIFINITCSNILSLHSSIAIVIFSFWSNVTILRCITHKISYS